MLESLGMVVNTLIILQRQMDLCEFEASLDYIVGSWITRARVKKQKPMQRQQGGRKCGHRDGGQRDAADTRDAAAQGPEGGRKMSLETTTRP